MPDAGVPANSLRLNGTVSCSATDLPIDRRHALFHKKVIGLREVLAAKEALQAHDTHNQH